MLRQSELVNLVKSYLPDVNETGLNRAYVFAIKSHGSQKRESGDPFYSHPIEVAAILAEYHLDYASIVAGLLHDTIEDTSVTYDDILHMFDKEIADLVEAVTKLSYIGQLSRATTQAENFKKLVLAMSSDIRVLMVKLADRLHNMRTLHYCKSEEKRLRIAQETLDIYAPLAERIGMNKMKDELQDLSFQIIHPDAFTSIQKRLDYLVEKEHDLINKIVNLLQQDLEKENLKATVFGRQKRPYSIFKKMSEKNRSFDQISDIMAFRIIVDNVADCYHALGIIHTHYSMIPGRYKDYISTPKPNGYKSLHTGVIGPFQGRIEIQIRTKQMHDEAEYGIAAHWAFKEKNTPTQIEGSQFRWLRELVELLQESSTSDEFFENTKLAMHRDKTFCFTPKGDLIGLPANATPVDFAYAIHAKVGDKCIGAKINNEIKPLRTILKNGDQVEILTSATQTPSPEWERFVVSPKAKSSIRRYLRLEQRGHLIEDGKQKLLSIYKAEKLAYSEKDLVKICPVYGKDTPDDILIAIAEGRINEKEVFYKIHPEKKISLNRVLNIFKRKTDKQYHHPIKGIFPGLSINYAKCCHPIPGEDILGIVVSGKGITVHRASCKTCNSISEDKKIPLEWDENKNNQTFTVRLIISVLNKPEYMSKITNILNKTESTLSYYKIKAHHIHTIDIEADISVKNTDDLSKVISVLKTLDMIVDLKRE